MYFAQSLLHFVFVIQVCTRDSTFLHSTFNFDLCNIKVFRGTQRQFSENICSKDDLRSRILRTFVVKFLACLPLLGFSNI